MNVYVLCNNDYPHSVFENLQEAERERERLNREDEKRIDDPQNPHLRRVYYHICTVPLIKETTR